MGMIPTTGWSNKVGTTGRSCVCGSWKQHWINISNQRWPSVCAVAGCTNPPALGGHIISSCVDGERIVPLCDSCNKHNGEFELKDGTHVPSANKSLTCEKKL